MVTRSEAFPSRYLKAEDVGQGVKWVIAEVNLADFKGDDGITKRKLVASFQNDDKLWVVNATNYNVIAGIYGEETDDWIGKEIVLYSTKVQFGHKMVDAIRCRAPKKPPVGGQAAAGPKPVPAPAPDDVSADDDFNDQVPF